MVPYLDEFFTAKNGFAVHAFKQSTRFFDIFPLHLLEYFFVSFTGFP